MKKAYIEYIKTKLRRKPPALKIVAGEDYYIYGNKMIIINCNQSTLTDMRSLGMDQKCLYYAIVDMPQDWAVSYSIIIL